jgi:predicted CXXCH cytochrome family protein
MPDKKVFFHGAIILACLSSAGCSRISKEKFLRTFFDGVDVQDKDLAIRGVAPLEEKKKLAANLGPAANLPEIPQQFFHPPFLEKSCDSCHNPAQSQRMISQGKDLCFSCHDDFSQAKKVVHYPVQEGVCIECHDPHQSPNQYLLKHPLPRLCFNCHEQKEVKASPAHQTDLLCSECHNPHASGEEK